jgi:hypothetical protein
MKRSILLVSIVLFFSLSGIAQTKNVDIDNYSFNYVYRTSPLEPRNPLFFNYFVAINGTTAAKNNIPVAEVTNALFIEGQQKTADRAGADLAIELFIGNILFKSSNVVERTEEVKKKDGTTTTLHHYAVKVLYTFESAYEIKSANAVLGKGAIYTATNQLDYISKEYGSKQEATDFWNNNRDVLTTEFYRDLSLKSASQVSSTASKRFGFPVVSGRDVIKITDEKKHNENATFRKAVNALKELLETMTPDTPMDNERAQGLIEYFKSIPVKYTDANSKADKNLRSAAYYNLCRIYLFLDDPANVDKYAELILANGQDIKDCGRMKKAAEDVRTILKRTKVKTRHFSPDQYFMEN